MSKKKNKITKILPILAINELPKEIIESLTFQKAIENSILSELDELSKLELDFGFIYSVLMDKGKQPIRVFFRNDATIGQICMQGYQYVVKKQLHFEANISKMEKRLKIVQFNANIISNFLERECSASFYQNIDTNLIGFIVIDNIRIYPCYNDFKWDTEFYEHFGI
jgi:hypothetical protein